MSNKFLNLLISSAGRRVELIQSFREAAQKIGCALRVIAVDVDPSWSPACQVADQAYEVPRCTAANFISKILEIVEKESIHLLIPTIDTELLIYAQNHHLFAEAGVRLHLADLKTIEIFRNKAKTMRVLLEAGIAVPQTRLLENFSWGEISPPLILKPLAGSCSQGIIKITNQAEWIEAVVSEKAAYLVQSLCSGKEYTVNAYYCEGRLISAVPHYRYFVRAGEVCFAETQHVPGVEEVAEQIGRLFQLSGAICFQGFAEKGRFVVIEINGRFGGGYPLAQRAGAAMTKWLIEEVLKRPPQYTKAWQKGVRMLRYDAAVFVETASA